MEERLLIWVDFIEQKSTNLTNIIKLLILIKNNSDSRENIDLECKNFYDTSFIFRII